MFQALENEIKALVGRFDGEAVKVAEEARDTALALLGDAKAELAKFEPLLGQFEGDLKTVIADLAPEVKSGIEALLAKLLAGAAPLLGKEERPEQM